MSSGAERNNGTNSGNLKSCVLVELRQTKQQIAGENHVTDAMAHSERIVDSVIRLRPQNGLEIAAEQDNHGLVEVAGREADQMPCRATSGYFEFGPFRLFPLERRLFRNNAPIELGSRALDILVLLSEHAGGVVAKHSIVESVLPGINVEESSLRVQIAKLRKALGEGQDGARYIANIAGRGYSLVAAVARSRSPHTHQPDALSHSSVQSLPRISKPIGRERDIAKIKALVASSGFVTLHGFGGIGKTTVAVAVAEELVRGFEDGLVYLDFGRMRSPDEMEATLARALGSTARECSQRLAIFDALVDRQLLVVFDGCEHLLDAATEVIEEIRHRFPQVTFLITSREQLRADGEHVYLLPPLEVPPDLNAVSAADIMRFPSARLLAERAVAAGYELEYSDNEARYLGRICAKLDGVPLALELVASRLVVHGLEGTDALCASVFALSWQGRRTAVPRQQTLRSSLEWGYALLSETEKVVLRRLSVFPGLFTLEEMQAAAIDELVIKRHDCIQAFGQLVAKSFVSGGRDGTFRIFQIARAYAWGKLLEAKEIESVSERLDKCGQHPPRGSRSHRLITRADNSLNPQLFEDSRLDELPGW
ncbi:ATP-binding protein [Rhizobium bangladeshense]|uniref:ATP-binding protein n=1 Tax=Rhizobium bangladeshense TaxID=1138189 RepID=UPI0007E591C6|nr:winged helix-turn-helix domain-containing protein [Rhizobium bangladeshense]